eukprot:3941273-Rhodomonas_salina.5
MVIRYACTGHGIARYTAGAHDTLGQYWTQRSTIHSGSTHFSRDPKIKKPWACRSRSRSWDHQVSTAQVSTATGYGIRGVSTGHAVSVLDTRCQYWTLRRKIRRVSTAPGVAICYFSTAYSIGRSRGQYRTPRSKGLRP